MGFDLDRHRKLDLFYRLANMAQPDSDVWLQERVWELLPDVYDQLTSSYALIQKLQVQMGDQRTTLRMLIDLLGLKESEFQALANRTGNKDYVDLADRITKMLEVGFTSGFSDR